MNDAAPAATHISNIKNDALRVTRSANSPRGSGSEATRGNSSIAITGDIFGHTSDATTRAAIDGLSDALGL